MPVLHATHETKKEQAQLLDQLTRLSRTHPDMTATALVQWYLCLLYTSDAADE